MNRIISLLFLVPFVGLSQFQLEIEVTSLEDHFAIPEVEFMIGNTGLISNHEGITNTYSVDISHLSDTLYANHAGFKFPKKPLYQHKYRVVNNRLIIRISGQPWKKELITLNLPIAASKKVKNNSIKIEHCYQNIPEIVSFQPKDQTKSKRRKKPTNPFVQAYDDLQDGYFVIETDKKRYRVPFLKEDWIQWTCLSTENVNTSNQRELMLLRLYFEEIETSRLNQIAISKKLQREVDSLSRIIDSLNLEINRMKGIITPAQTDPFYLESDPIEAIDPVYFFLQRQAKPVIGHNEFQAGLIKALSEQTVSYSGNITIEIVVAQSGRTTINILHSGSSDKQQLLNQATEYLRTHEWEPALSVGRPVKTAVVFSLDIHQSDSK